MNSLNENTKTKNLSEFKRLLKNEFFLNMILMIDLIGCLVDKLKSVLNH